MFRKPAFVLLSLAVLGGSVLFVTRRLTINRVASAQVVARPFTLEQITLTFQNNPAGEVANKRVLAVRADGSEAYLETVAGGRGIARRLRMADGTYAGIVDFIQAKMTGYLRKDEMAHMKSLWTNPPRDCVFPGSDTLVGHEKLFGIDAAIVRVEYRNRAIRKTHWRFPEFACTMVRSVLEERQADGTYRLVSETRPVVFGQGEPDARLFERSDRYKEMPPSDLKREALAKLGVTPETCPECYKNNMSPSDAEYLKQLSQPPNQ
jgi:hypothetical protein